MDLKARISANVIFFKWFLIMFFKWFKEFPVRIAKAKLLINYGGEQDDWSSNVVDFSLNSLGCKSNKDMSIYMKGESKVNVSTVVELCNWLLDCEYVSYDGLSSN